MARDGTLRSCEGLVTTPELREALGRTDVLVRPLSEAHGYQVCWRSVDAVSGGPLLELQVYELADAADAPRFVDAFLDIDPEAQLQSDAERAEVVVTDEPGLGDGA